MPMYDLVVLTDARYVSPENPDAYTHNVLLEDQLVLDALARRGFRVWRTHWDNPDFDWSETRFALFRTTWDYFDRFPEFSAWLEKTQQQTTLLNLPELIHWNVDKHYLQDLSAQGVRIPPTRFFEVGETASLTALFEQAGWPEAILKPAVSGAARHTYRINKDSVGKHEAIFAQLIAKEAMLLQEFQQQVLSKGEVALMVFNGRFSHAILKKAKAGDFRVQDDFGGTVHDYQAAEAEIRWAEEVVKACDSMPIYARVDMIWDNEDQPCLSELELIEPELWFRNDPKAADRLADALEPMLRG